MQFRVLSVSRLFNAKSFGENSDVTVKKGFIEDFSSVEFRIGHVFNDHVNMFFYGGIDKYRGSSASETSYFSSSSFAGAGILANNKFEGADHYGQSFENHPRYKAHLEFEIGDFTTWLRYTKSGSQGVLDGSTINNFGLDTHETGSQQISWSGVYEHDFTEFLKGRLFLKLHNG